MATDLPYMQSVGNVSAILAKIRNGGTPPKFTGEFVKTTLGFTASQDRAFPKMLRQLRFIDQSGVPLPRYNEFKSASGGGRAMAQGLQEGWQPIFMADQRAHALPASDLKDIFKTVTGQGDAVAKKMATTFKAFADHGDWDAVDDAQSAPVEDAGPAEQAPSGQVAAPAGASALGVMNLHHDIHLHLPPTSDVAVYRAIFRALREELQ